MAMTQKHFEAMAEEAGVILSEINGEDLALTIILRADVADVIERVVTAGAKADHDTRYDKHKFCQAMWAAAANHS